MHDLIGLTIHRVSNTCKSGTFEKLILYFKWTVLEEDLELEARIQTTGPGIRHPEGL